MQRVVILAALPLLVIGQTINLPEMKSFVLDNGLKVIVVENHEQPAVLYSMMFKSGGLQDKPGKEGETELLGKLLEGGSKNYSADRLAERIDFLGARFDVEVSREYLGIELMVLSKDRLEGLDILSDIVINPTFPDAELELARKELIAEIKWVMDAPQGIAEDHLRNVVFRGERRGTVKTLNSVGSIQRDDIVGIYTWHFAPDNAVLVIVGEVQYDSIARNVQERFSDWRAKPKQPRKSNLTGVEEMKTGTGELSPLRIRLVDKPGLTQSFIALGFPSIKRDNPDYFAYLAMNHVLGGAGFASRLMSVVRAQQGKTYGISSRFEAGVYPGPFMIRTFTQTGQTREMIELIVKVMTEMKEKGITEEELEHVKTNQIGGYQLRFQTPSDLAREILATELYGLGLDYLRAYPEKISTLTIEGVNQAAAKYLDVTEFCLVVVSAADEVEKLVEPLGAFETVPYNSLYTK